MRIITAATAALFAAAFAVPAFAACAGHQQSVQAPAPSTTATATTPSPTQPQPPRG